MPNVSRKKAAEPKVEEQTNDLGMFEPMVDLTANPVPVSTFDDSDNLEVFSRSGKIPKYATEGSACFDLEAYLKEGDTVSVYRFDNSLDQVRVRSADGVGYFVLGPSQRALIPTGLFFNIPKGYEINVYARSGTSWKNGLCLTNSVGIIDSDYTNELMVSMINHSGRAIRIQNGERIAQAALRMSTVANFVPIKALPKKKGKRVGGFGSTGVK